MKKVSASTGFTLVELLLVIGIIATLGVIGIPNYLGLRNRKRLDSAVERVVREINLGISRSRSQEDGAQWWIHFENPDGADNDFYLVCNGTYSGVSGANCGAEGGIQQSKVPLGVGLEFTGFTDIITGGTAKDTVFAKSTGLPTISTTVTINSTSEGASRIITVNGNGSVSY